MHDTAREIRHAGPFRRVAFRMAIVSLTHPEKACGEAKRLAGVGSCGFDRPAISFAGPPGRIDPVTVADVSREVVLFDHLTHVPQDLGGGGNRLSNPGFESITEGV